MQFFLSEKKEIFRQYDFSKFEETRKKINLRDMLIRMQEWYKSILNNSPQQLYVATTTRVNNNRFLNKKWAFFLDCDSDENLVLAIDYLIKVRKTKYNIVQSSPGRYWIIADIIGPFNTILSETSLVPGVDEKYVNYARSCGQFFVRAFPNNFSTYKSIKDGKTVFADAMIPIFPEKSELTNPLVQKWYNNLKDYYEQDLVPIYNYIKLSNHLKNLGPSNYIMDPTKCLNI